MPRRDFVARFKQTILGPFWFVLNPLLSTFIYTFIFAGVAKIPTDDSVPALFYLTGIVSWNYFANCLNSSSGTFLGNAGIFGKVYFPRLVSPISSIISNLIQFGIQFALLLVMMAYYYLKGNTIHWNIYIAMIPFVLLLLAFLGFGIGIIISSLTVKYRDLTNLMGFGVQLWMYATPVIYPVSFVPEKYKMFVLLNPVAPLVEMFKYGLIGAGQVNWTYFLYSIIFTCVVVFIGILTFNRVEGKFTDTV